MNVGLPAIGSALQGSAGGLQWVITAYLLPLSALVLIGGALGDRWGRGRVFVGGIVLFGVASVACALAPSLGWLIASRALQGVAAALLTPNSLAILNDTFDGPARGRAIGIWAAAAAATSGFGPILGGWLIDEVGWRSIFMINLPLAAAALVLGSRTISLGAGIDRAPLDLTGAALATLGLGALTFALVFGAGPEGSTMVALLGSAGGVVILTGFAAWEWSRGDRAMMPIRLFSSRDFGALTVLTLLLYGALGALVVLLPFTLMRGGGASVLAAGAAMLPVTALLAALSSLFGGLAARLGARPLLAAGCAAIAAGLLLFLSADAGSDYWTRIFPALLVIGTGLAAAVAPLTAAILGSVEPRFSGTASGFNNATARTGGLIATACLGRALASTGTDLILACHTAAVLSAIACLLAAAAALAVRRKRTASL